MIMAVLSKSDKKKKFYSISGLLFLLFFTNPLIINQLMKKWEYPETRKDELPLVKSAIVLGGILDETNTDSDLYKFNDHSERLLESLVMLNEGLIRNIIISGGSGSVLNKKDIESKHLSQFSNDLGIKKSKIKIDSVSRNTFENAIEVSKILEKEGLKDQPILLVTSAYHMRRAMMCFEKQGINCIPFPVDYCTSNITINPKWILPDYYAIKLWETYIKERIGIISYQIFGYI